MNSIKIKLVGGPFHGRTCISENGCKTLVVAEQKLKIQYVNDYGDVQNNFEPSFKEHFYNFVINCDNFYYFIHSQLDPNKSKTINNVLKKLNNKNHDLNKKY